MIKVLIVDDEETIREGIKMALELADMSVETACDGQQGIVKISESDFDAMVVDVSMPVMGGVEMIQTLRSQAVMVPVILCSAHISQETRKFANNDDQITILEKPMKPSEIRDAVVLAASK